MKTQVLLGVRTSTGVKCLAEPKDSNGKVIKMSKQLFRENEPYYSVQGDTGLCCRHALAKALLESWIYSFTDEGHLQHPMDLRSMIAFLITSV